MKPKVRNIIIIALSAVLASVIVFVIVQSQGSKAVVVETIKPDTASMGEEVYKYLTDSPDALANNELGISFGNGIQVWKKGPFEKYSKEATVFFPVYNRNNKLIGILSRHYENDEAKFFYSNDTSFVDNLKLVMSYSSKVMIISVDENTMFFAGDKATTKLGSGLVKDDSAYAKVASIYGNEVTDDRYPLGE